MTAGRPPWSTRPYCQTQLSDYLTTELLSPKPIVLHAEPTDKVNMLLICTDNKLHSQTNVHDVSHTWIMLWSYAHWQNLWMTSMSGWKKIFWFADMLLVRKQTYDGQEKNSW